MTDVPYTWIFIALAAVVDMVGLFYMWRRRNHPVATGHRPLFVTGERVRISLAERRGRDRRGRGQAASA